MARPMPNAQVLDVIEALFHAAQHPDYTSVARYGRDSMPGGQSPAGVSATHLSGSRSMLSLFEPRPGTFAVAADDSMMTTMAGRTLYLTMRLLDAARPSEFTRWELHASPGVGWPDHGRSPSAILLTGVDGSIAYLRATAASGPRGGAAEPKQDPFPDYQIPQEVVQWHHSQSAARAVPVSV